MNWSTSVLSSISSDTEPTVVISFDSGKYVFNAGENTGRAWLSSKASWRKTKGVFLTSVGVQHTGGLPGLLMFLTDAGSSNVELVGPRGLTHLLASMRSYLFRNSILVKRTEVDMIPVSSSDPEPIFHDDTLTVYGIPLSVGASSSLPTDDQAPQIEDDDDVGVGKRKRTPSPDTCAKRPRSEQASVTENLSIDKPTDPQELSAPEISSAEADSWRCKAVDAMFPFTSLSTQAVESMESKKKFKRPQDETTTASIDATIAPYDDIPDQPEKKFSYSPGFALKNKRLPRHIRSECAERLCYVCVGPRVRGKFDMKKAMDLKIPRGPLLGKLTKGETITFMVNDGKGGQEQRTVRPEECVGPSEIPKVVIILDVPSPAHVAALSSAFENSPFYRQMQSQGSDQYEVSTVYHLCGEGVLEDSRYKAFMNTFASSVHHVVASREHANDPITFTAAAYNQLMLHQLDEQIFPVPKFSMHPQKSLSDVSGLPTNTLPMASSLHIPVRPPQAPTYDEPTRQEQHFIDACTSSTAPTLPLDIMDAINNAKEESHALQTIERPSRPGDDVVVVPLGTCSAAPSKHRNVSSTLIQIPRWGNVLLDCGEGTWGQLTRLFGDDSGCSTGVWQVLRGLKCVYISHVHGDHHIGLRKLLAMRRKLNPPPTEPLYVVGVYAILLYLRELNDLEDLGIDREDGTGVVTILSDALSWTEPRPYENDITDEPWMDFELATKDATKMCQSLDLEDFITVEVRHRTRCYGVVLKHHDGWSIVYSGDTMPCDKLVRAGPNATLLIHEATMADDQADLAFEKAHSTFGQAVEIGNRMKAENILLTHFSTRYPKLPRSIFSYRSGNPFARQPNLALAFDQACMPLGEIYKFKAYLPAIEKCFSIPQDEDEIIE
ncbi:hypothetical protein BDY19DRAFT_890423 [Irpex rosettiformis]|uniref:Uncharacterized protein n=1 Tax=Irpex rosettiformis TaxID=378272 RepID=A0ACB8U3L1_9APHY|nr:hypothetical protein BDY19DRAFT_890423 [Irpex rosettiformis]